MQTITQTGRRILYTEAGRPACEVRGDTLYRRARGSVHMLRRPPAWSFDAVILHDAELAGAQRAVVVDTENNTAYETSLDLFWVHGVRIQRGHGAQIALPLKWWHVEDPRQPRLF